MNIATICDQTFDKTFPDSDSITSAISQAGYEVCLKGWRMAWESRQPEIDDLGRCIERLSFELQETMRIRDNWKTEYEVMKGLRDQWYDQVQGKIIGGTVREASHAHRWCKVDYWCDRCGVVKSTDIPPVAVSPTPEVPAPLP